MKFRYSPVLLLVALALLGAVAPTQKLSVSMPLTSPAASQAANLCQNSFHPVSPNAQWTYTITGLGGDPNGLPYNMTITNITPNSFTEHRQFPDGAADTNWVCTPDGLAATQPIDVTTAGRGTVQVQTQQYSGVTLPPVERWTTGATWTNSYRVKGQMQTAIMAMSGDATIDVQNKIAGKESVVVAAGTYDALRVDSTAPAQLSLSLGIFGVPMTFNLVGSSWYVQDIGLVKSTLVVQGQPISITTELTSFKP